jgi:ligand-binding sensor domain-containing protein
MPEPIDKAKEQLRGILECMVLVGTETGLWRWKPGPPRLYPMKDGRGRLSEAAGGDILIATNTGVKQFSEGRIEAYPVLGGKPFQARVLLRDRDGGLWVGTLDRGLLHVYNGRTDVFARSNGLSDDFISVGGRLRDDDSQLRKQQYINYQDFSDNSRFFPEFPTNRPSMEYQRNTILG